MCQKYYYDVQGQGQLTIIHFLTSVHAVFRENVKMGSLQGGWWLCLIDTFYDIEVVGAIEIGAIFVYNNTGAYAGRIRIRFIALTTGGIDDKDTQIFCIFFRFLKNIQKSCILFRYPKEHTTFF